MREYEYKISSQFGEDGIIEHIFNSIGVTNKIAVEIGVSADNYGNPTGAENNTRNLSTKGWTTFWFDGMVVDSIPENCTFTQKFLTKDNICNTFEELNIPKEFDLLSIDVDGNDYHFREALSIYSPRVVIMEYNGMLGPDVEYIMPYDENFQWSEQIHFGASLLSFEKQADRLGYNLVYCNSVGNNAFFIRKDITIFPPKTTLEAYVKFAYSSHFLNNFEIKNNAINNKKESLNKIQNKLKTLKKK